MLGAICGSAQSMDCAAQSVDPYIAQESMDCAGICGSRLLARSTDLPVSRARSSPVPGVVAYFRPSYAAARSSPVPGVVAGRRQRYETLIYGAEMRPYGYGVTT